jgi:hypothetical protein
VRLEKAGPENNEELRKFFDQFSLNSVLEVRMRRPTDFFAPYRLQSDEYETLVLRDEKDNSLHGLASFVYRNTYFQDHVQKIAIATDLRILPSRKAIINWSQHFLPVLRDTMKEHGVNSVFSVINSYDTAAFNAFVRPRQMKRALPRYHLYRKFRLVSLHGRYPWAPLPVKALRIRQGESRWIGPLIDYIQKRAPYRAFASAWDEKSFFDKIGRLPGFRLEDFWIAFDSQERVVGTLAPWSPLHVQEYCPLTYGLQAHNFRQFLKFGRLLGWTRPLTKPLSRTGEEAPLKFRFLTFVSADNEDIFESLLWTAFEATPPDEFLVYGHCLQDFKLNPPLSWISAELPFGLYGVIPPEMDPPSFLHPTQLINPEIEACYFF